MNLQAGHDSLRRYFATLSMTKFFVTLNSFQGLTVKVYKHFVHIYNFYIPIILSFLSDEKRKNNVYPNKKEKKTAPAESLLLIKTRYFATLSMNEFFSVILADFGESVGEQSKRTRK